MRRFAAVLAVLGVLAFTFVPASAATAAQTLPVPSVETPDFTPSPTKWREYVLNVTSKMLSKASGGQLGLTGSWRAEQIANQHRFAPSAEQLNRMHGFAQSYNPNYATNPSSYEDYILRNSTRTTQNGSELRVQATAGQRFARGLATGGSALAAMTLVPVIGGGGSDVLGGWMGQTDVQGEWCRAMPEMDSGLGAQVLYRAVDILSGRMCAFNEMSGNHEPNSDLTAGTIPGSVGGYTIGFPVHKVSNGWCYATNGWQTTGTRISGSSPRVYVFMYFPDTKKWGSVGLISTGACPQNSLLGYFYDALTEAPSLYGLSLRSAAQLGDEAPEGVPTTQTADNPNRYQECVVTLDDGTTLSGRGADYTDNDGSFAAAPCPAVPAGRHATNIAVNEHVDNGNGTTTTTSLYDQPTSPEYVEWATSYPECAEGACALDLVKKTGPDTGLSCFDVTDGCPDWYQDPDKTTNYECRYGANSVELDECTIYAGLFKPGRVEVGGAYSDPLTGEWSGGSNSPTLDRQAMGQTVQNPASTRSCNGLFQSNGFDPVGFVLRPIQCALEWAFVPRPLVVEAELAGGEASWEGKPPAVIASAVGSFSLTPAVSGCSRSVTIFSGIFEQTITPIDVCPGSMARPFADASRVVTAAAMVVLVVVVVRRQIAGMVGYGQGQ